MNKYDLPKLDYDYNELAPIMGEEQLRIHHTKHHQAYVTAANNLFDKIDKARKEGTDIDIKAVLKDLSFQIGGHLLHSLFWKNLTKPGTTTIEGNILNRINEDFGSFERFKKEFTQAAMTTEGSGWATLVYDFESDRLLICQIEKHNINVYPTLQILLIIDVFEHAYYLDYKNDRSKFVENFWKIINWVEVEARYNQIIKKD